MMTTDAGAADLLQMIERLGVGPRASLGVSYNGTGYFAITPEHPFDDSLTVTQQTHQLLKRADARLADMGTGKDRLLFVVILVPDIADAPAVNAVWDEWVAGIAPPSRVCLEAKLGHAGLKVEMVMISAVPEKV